MATYLDYFTGAKKHYEIPSAPAFLKDPLNSGKHFEKGTPGYLIAIIYFVLKGYSQGIRTAFEYPEIKSILRRNFQTEATELLAFIENVLSSASSLTQDRCFAQILEHLRFTILKILMEKPRNLNGDFSHACLAIFIALHKTLTQRKKHLMEARKLSAAGKTAELSEKKPDDASLNTFLSSFNIITNFHRGLGMIRIGMMNHFIVPMHLVVTMDDLNELNIRFKRYWWLAQKAVMPDSRQAIIEILEAYAIRYKPIGGIPIATYRTHRTQVNLLISQLKIAKTTPQEAINLMATFPTTANSEFQHVLLGIYCAFMQNGRGNQARTLSKCPVKIGAAETMNIASFYNKYVADVDDSRQSERYKAYLELSTFSEEEAGTLLGDKSENKQGNAKTLIVKIMNYLELIYLNKFPDKELSELVSSMEHLRENTPILGFFSSPPRRIENTVLLRKIITTLIRIAQFELEKISNPMLKQEEILCLLCATYDLLKKARWLELAESIGNLSIENKTYLRSAGEDTDEEEVLDPSLNTVAKLHAYLADDSPEAMDDAASHAEAGSTDGDALDDATEGKSTSHPAGDESLLDRTTFELKKTHPPSEESMVFSPSARYITTPVRGPRLVPRMQPLRPSPSTTTPKPKEGLFSSRHALGHGAGEAISPPETRAFARKMMG